MVNKKAPAVSANGGARSAPQIAELSTKFVDNPVRKLAAIDPKKWLSEGHRSAIARRARARAMRSVPECWDMAGRAVAAAAIGVRFGSVKVSGERGYFVGKSRGNYRNPDSATVAAVGALSEFFHSLNAEVFAKKLAAVGSFYGEDLQQTLLRAQTFLHEHRDVVEKVAADLHKRGELTEADVQEHFRSRTTETENRHG